MTKNDSDWWLLGMAKKKGITVDEMRTLMSERSKLADKRKSGFASLSPEKLKEVTSKGGQAGRKKNDTD